MKVFINMVAWYSGIAFFVFCFAAFLIEVIRLCLYFDKEERNRKWDVGIRNKEAFEYCLSTKLDEKKEIVYLPMRIVGYWTADKTVVNNPLEENPSYRRYIEYLAQEYNLILQVPESFEDIYDEDNTIEYIRKEKLPICYVTRKLPSADMITWLRKDINNEVITVAIYREREDDEYNE